MSHVITSSAPRGLTGMNDRSLSLSAIRSLQGGLGMLIYVARTPDGLIKIGASENVAQRITKIRATEVLALRPGNRAAELAIHRQLAGHAARGREWYHPTPEVMAVVNEMREDFNLPHIAA